MERMRKITLYMKEQDYKDIKEIAEQDAIPASLLVRKIVHKHILKNRVKVQ